MVSPLLTGIVPNKTTNNEQKAKLTPLKGSDGAVERPSGFPSGVGFEERGERGQGGQVGRGLGALGHKFPPFPPVGRFRVGVFATGFLGMARERAQGLKVRRVPRVAAKVNRDYVVKLGKAHYAPAGLAPPIIPDVHDPAP